MRQLIVRADDLGYSEGISLGILAAHRDGIVTCTSVMINMPYAKKAIELAKQYPNLSLGLHVNVTNGKAIGPRDKIVGLVDEDGVFISSNIRRKQILDKKELFTEEEAYYEAKAQVELFKELVGRLPDYIDVHVLEVEPLLNAICRVQEEYNIQACPYNDDDFKICADQVMEQYNFYQYDHEHFVNIFEEEHFIFHDRVDLFVCHPGFIDYYASTHTSMIQERLWDFGLVTDSKVKEWLIDNEVELVNFVNYK